MSARYRKAIVATVAFIAQLLALGVLPAEAQPYVTAAIAALTAIGVYQVPNAEGDDMDAAA